MKRLLASLATLLSVGAVCAQTFTESEEIATNVDLSTWRVAVGSVGDELGGSEGKLRFFCEVSHLGYNDPIVNPNQNNASHLHHFFGNTLVNEASTYESLRTTGSGTCAGGPANRTAYWVPAMINGANNKVVIPRMIEFYYQIAPANRYLNENPVGQQMGPGCPGNPNIACPQYAYHPTGIPKGLKVVQGVNPLTGVNDDGVTIQWRCVNIGGAVKGAVRSLLWDPVTPANGLDDCTTSDDGNATNTYMVNVVMNFNACWSGALDSANHHTHLAAPIPNGVMGNTCPAANPILLPTVTLFVYYDHSGPSDIENWYLASDRYNGANFKPGQTFHSDAYWAWDPDVMRTIVEYIWALDGTQQNRTTNNGILGDGTRLSEAAVPVDMSFLPAASRYADIPPQRRSGRGIRGRGRR